MLFLLVTKSILSQTAQSVYFDSPLTIPLFLSGNFGELRANHFHAGIDFKTEGVTGKPVLAAAGGFVSRIKVQSGGYGNSLYITHPNGYTTVYAHLDRFVPAIQDYVKQLQYQKKSFEIELFPGSTRFVFKKGDVIAYSGNTGSSGGPHLHFEIRRTNGQVPLNGLRHNFPIADNKSPEFKNLYVYAFADPQIEGNNGEVRTAYPVTKVNASAYRIDQTVSASGNFMGFGTEIYDFMNGSANKCGVYKLELFIGDKRVYGFVIDAISFAQTRYINAHMDYEVKTHEGKSVHRLFSYPNNKLPIYYPGNTYGLFNFMPDSVYAVRIEAYDAYDNKSTLSFKIAKTEADAETVKMQSGNFADWQKGLGARTEIFDISIPANALYRSVFLDIRAYKDTYDTFRDTLYFHYDSEPLHISATIRADVSAIDTRLRQKLIFARISDNKPPVSEGGEISGNQLIASSRNFGKYVLMADTIPPEIKALNVIPGRNYTAGQKLDFEITDTLSGLGSYEIIIDGSWALPEYDAKSNRLSYTIDGGKLEAGKKHTFKLTAGDLKNNEREFRTEFQY
jgi:murein DD-endopeptidase MepM/ murein hydrolase activator NlpD